MGEVWREARPLVWLELGGNDLFFFSLLCLESSPSKVGLILCGLFCFILLRKMGDDPACLGMKDLKGKTKNGWLLTLSAWVEDKLESKRGWGKCGLLIGSQSNNIKEQGKNCLVARSSHGCPEHPHLKVLGTENKKGECSSWWSWIWSPNYG